MLQLSPTSPSLEIELRLVDDLALLDSRPPHDQLEDALVARRGAQRLEPRLELAGVA